MSLWRWVNHEDQRLTDIGVNEDGSLHNPHRYPEELVRAAVRAAEERLRARRSAAAKKAAGTRRGRVEKRIYAVANNLASAKSQRRCYICGKGLDDPESIARGIGSDCWQRVLHAIEALKS